MLKELETLSKLPPQVRQDVETYCRVRQWSYGAILKANRGDIWEMGKVNALIRFLAARRHVLADIRTAAGVEKEYARRVLKIWRSEQETPIRTIDYERLAT